MKNKKSLNMITLSFCMIISLGVGLLFGLFAAGTVIVQDGFCEKIITEKEEEVQQKLRDLDVEWQQKKEEAEKLRLRLKEERSNGTSN